MTKTSDASGIYRATASTPNWVPTSSGADVFVHNSVDSDAALGLFVVSDNTSDASSSYNAVRFLSSSAADGQ